MTGRAWRTLTAILLLSGILLGLGSARPSAATSAPFTASPAPTVATVALVRTATRCPLGMPTDFPCQAVVNDYPHWHGTRPQRECGEFTLWRLARERHQSVSYLRGMLASTGVQRAAADLDDSARRLGYRVDHSPAVGAVGVLERGFHGASRQHGHVVFIARVSWVHHNMIVEDYSWSSPYRYSTRAVAWGYVSWVVHLVGPPHPHPAVGH